MGSRWNDRNDTNEAERPRLDAIALLPSAATLGNLLCGVLAIFCCLLAIRGEYVNIPVREFGPRLTAFFPSYIAVGAYLIVGSMLFDALDGRLARLARRTSEFGAQLDSVSDVVSFGAAPVLLFLTLALLGSLPGNGAAPYVSGTEWAVALLGALVYVSCAAIRLARYNAENTRGEEAQNRFSGLPVPGAAAALVALLVVHEHIALVLPPTLFDWDALVRWAIGPTALALGLLMVSRLDYVHVFNVYVRRDQPLSHLVLLVVVVALVWRWPQFLLAVVAFAYVISGFVLNLKRRAAADPAATDAEQPRTPVDMN